MKNIRRIALSAGLCLASIIASCESQRKVDELSDRTDFYNFISTGTKAVRFYDGGTPPTKNYMDISLLYSPNLWERNFRYLVDNLKDVSFAQADIQSEEPFVFKAGDISFPAAARYDPKKVKQDLVEIAKKSNVSKKGDEQAIIFYRDGREIFRLINPNIYHKENALRMLKENQKDN